MNPVIKDIVVALPFNLAYSLNSFCFYTQALRSRQIFKITQNIIGTMASDMRVSCVILEAIVPVDIRRTFEEINSRLRRLTETDNNSNTDYNQ